VPVASRRAKRAALNCQCGLLRDRWYAADALIHCLAAPAEEKDHVLPRGWYPDGTPATIQRLTVPSCKACGAKLKKAEEQTALALMCARGFDKDHVAALGVYDRVRATWDMTAPARHAGSSTGAIVSTAS
jgi:hypothetical protein